MESNGCRRRVPCAVECSRLEVIRQIRLALLDQIESTVGSPGRRHSGRPDQRRRRRGEKTTLRDRRSATWDPPVSSKTRERFYSGGGIRCEERPSLPTSVRSCETLLDLPTARLGQESKGRCSASVFASASRPRRDSSAARSARRTRLKPPRRAYREVQHQESQAPPRSEIHLRTTGWHRDRR